MTLPRERLLIVNSLNPALDLKQTVPRRKSIQFSVLSLMLMVLSTGAVMGLWFSQRDIGQLREELGVLNVEDPTKLYARSLIVNDNLKWRWRVYFPATQTYVIKVEGGQIAETGFPRGSGSSSTFTAQKGEYTLEADARPATAGQIEIHLVMPYGSLTCSTTSTDAGFDDWVRGASSSSGLPSTSTAYDPEKPLELLRVRAMKLTSADSASISSEPSPGVLIWIEPAAVPTAPTPSSNTWPSTLGK